MKVAPIFKETFRRWREGNSYTMAAALSYYTLFSLGPLLIIAVAVAGILFGEAAATGELSTRLNSVLGPTGAEAVQSIASHSQKDASTSSIIGLAILVIAAMGVFLELKNTLNSVWRVKLPNRTWWKALLKDRALSFVMVLSIGIFLMGILAVNVLVSEVGRYLGIQIAGSSARIILELVTLVSFAGMFAFIFKMLPDTEVHWKDVWLGAGVTSLLFNIGKFAIGLYLGHAVVASAFGASASVALILVWAYYSSLIFIFGAHFTACYAMQYGSRRALNSIDALANPVRVRDIRLHAKKRDAGT